MNIFILDNDPIKAAQYACNSHCSKMILESAQLLSTCHRVCNNHDPLLYKITHVNHPCSIWVRESVQNYRWLYRYYIALGAEYTFRYGKTHKSMGLRRVLLDPPLLVPDLKKLTPFAQTMPDEYKDADAVTAYRKFYLGGKAHLLKYTKREIPEWMPLTSVI